MTPIQTRSYGFAAMSPEQRKAISSKGGKAAHEQGVAHKFTSAEAYIAGRRGGDAVARDRQHMADIGRLGGLKTAAARKQSRSSALAEAA
jgi:uncharacterized protein